MAARVRATVTVVTMLALLVLLATSAAGLAEGSQRSPRLTIQHLVAEPDGTTLMTVSISGLEPGQEVSLEQLEVVENGEPVQDLQVAGSSSETAAAVVPAVVVAMDTSGSAEGDPIESAKTAATSLAEQVVAGGGRIGVVGFGEETATLSPLSDTAADAVSSLSSIEAAGGTALYDGVSRAARLLAGHDGPRDVVVFSDGEDTTSRSDLDDVRALLEETGVRVTSVVLRSENFAIAPLEAMAAINDGGLVEVDAATDLAGAFAAVAGDLTNRLDVRWVAEEVTAPEPTLNVVATYRTEDGPVSDGAQVDNPRLVSIAPPVEVQPPPPLVPAFASDLGLSIAVVTIGLVLFILLVVILTRAGEARRRGELDERLAAYQPGVGERGREDRVSISDRASGFFDAIPRPDTLDSRIAASIEHADWPLRVSEFMLISIGAGVLGFLVGGVLLGSLALGAVVGLVGLSGPWVYLQAAVSRRRAAFAEQLPTVLQVLAGALRAGHAFSTALEGTVGEVDEPARSELRRASVEARLGRPLDRALGGVAQRMDSTDLQWVIGALEVQREVGGNLAEILGNVAETLRDRASIGRHVKALTAEGRLSAVFISAMPFVMFLYLWITNPDYVGVLFTEPLGRVMLGTGMVLLVVGVIVLRRLVRPKY